MGRGGNGRRRWGPAAAVLCTTSALPVFAPVDRRLRRGDAVVTDPADSSEKHFPRGFRPTRASEPLVSILAMTGMITGPEAEEVGRS